jgi:hypothetical protein
MSENPTPLASGIILYTVQIRFRPLFEEVRSVAATLEQRRKQRFQFLRSLYEMSRGSERVLFYVEEVGDAVGLGALDAEAAAQYLGEKRLIRVVMANIISISQAGADELETALEQPEQPTTHFPPAQGIPSKPVTAPPAIAGHAFETPPVREVLIQEAPIPEAPIPEPPTREEPTREASIPEASTQPLPAHIVENDSDELAAAELKRICAAIGLDPQEITGELSPRHNRPIPEPVHSPPEPRPDLHTEKVPPFLFSKADLDVILESLSQQLPKLGLAPIELAEAQAENDTARAQLASSRPKQSILAASLRTLLSILENAGPPLATDTRENLTAIRDFQQRLSA